MAINDVVQAARRLETAKAELETLRNRKAEAQALVDRINQQLPGARAEVATAKTALADAVAGFDTN